MDEKIFYQMTGNRDESLGLPVLLSGKNTEIMELVESKSGKEGLLKIEAVSNSYKDMRVKYALSFKKDVGQIMEIDILSSSLLWIYAGDHHCRLIDLQTENVIYDVILDGNYSCLKSYVDQADFLILNKDSQQIIKLTMAANEKTFQSHTFIRDYNGNISPDVIPYFLVRRAGGVIVFVSKMEGCLCLNCYVPYIQHYNSKTELVREKRLKLNRKTLIVKVISMAENYNGHICLAGSCNSHYSRVVVLNLQFRLHFVYRGNPMHKDMHGPLFNVSSLATNSKNEILIVTGHGSYIDIINENGMFITRWSIESFCDEISCQRILVDSEDKLWVVLFSNKIICIDLKMKQ